MARVEPSRSPSSDQGPQVLPLPEAMLLPDRHPQRGMSVVPALTGWLVHTNRRCNGSWTQCYQHGIPVTDLTSIPTTAQPGPPCDSCPIRPWSPTRTSRDVSYLS